MSGLHTQSTVDKLVSMLVGSGLGSLDSEECMVHAGGYTGYVEQRRHTRLIS